MCQLLQNSNAISFLQGMRLPLSMTPDYSNFKRQFSFGKMPYPAQGIQAKHTPYLARRPSAGGLRKFLASWMMQRKMMNKELQQKYRALAFMSSSNQKFRFRKFIMYKIQVNNETNAGVLTSATIFLFIHARKEFISFSQG
jgi:hypothetical protein